MKPRPRSRPPNLASGIVTYAIVFRATANRPLAVTDSYDIFHHMDAQAILKGRGPSVVFDEYLAANPSQDKFDVARTFAEAFPATDSVCYQVIWNWRRPGMDDGKLNRILAHELKRAGYHLKAD